jgi:tRNA(His) guanylyltransferase
MADDFGDRMKAYEMAEAGRKFMPLLPIMCRLDGRSFSNFTKGFKRPYDIGMSNLMVDTVKYLVEETNANCGYTQSDEITLTWYAKDYKSEIFFGGRISKMNSVLSSMCSVYFNRHMANYNLPEKALKKMPVFDCRVWQVPNIIEGTNSFLWREQDATKNSISMAARHYYSHANLHNKNSSEMQDMLMDKGVNWNDYPSFFKRGSYIQRKKSVARSFTAEEIEKLPPKHEARFNPNMVVERTDIVVLNLPPLSKVQNRDRVIYFGEEPKLFVAEDKGVLQ